MRRLGKASCLGLAAFALTALGTSGAGAQEKQQLSPYERDTIAEALSVTKSEVDPAPDGKTIEAVIVRPLDVLEPRDPLPMFLIDFLNFFHATTRPGVIEQYVLLKRGDAYDQRLADETARNLRGIRQLSLVLVVPLKGSRDDTIKLLVIAKDIWSLRLNSDFRLANDQLEYLLLAPSEENLAGLHHAASLRFELQPDTYAFGASYKVPRIGGSWVSGAVSTNFIVNRDTGDLEGSFGTFSYGQPLYSTRAEWSWIAAVAWRSEVTRFFEGVEPKTFDFGGTPDDPESGEHIPIQYETDTLAARLSFVRSFGSAVKHDILFGAEASRSAYRPLDLSAFSPEAREAFITTQIPRSDKRVYPYIGYSTYSTRFRSYVDFETLGLQEDYRQGHDAYVKVYPVIKELASDRSFIGAAAGASASVAIGDGHARAYVQGLVEASPETVYDANALIGFRGATPRLGIGRLIVDGFYFDRFANFLNKRSTLGGEGRLRGYPSGAYRGENVVAANLEFRSRPAELWTVQLGATAFFDTGAAWDDGDEVDLRQSIGTGLRLVFPQLERTVMRLDWAFPLELDESIGVTTLFPGRFIVTFEQAFPMPGVDPPSVTQ
ncbi:MAG: hypothetical protein HOW73_29345 [Polyangiaceae bacterium]|nr:hypothetical protein [Polyangiaceae bacterium]